MWLLLNLLINLSMATVDESISIEEVYRHQRQGQYVEAQEILDTLVLANDTPVNRFEWARNLELQGEYEPALQVYNELYRLRFTGEFGLNIAYRRGLMLSNLGEHRTAVRTLKRLRWRTLSALDRRGVQLALGAAEIQAGQVERGMRRIEKVLGHLEQPNEWSWLQARARMAICEHLLILASDTTLQAGDGLKVQMDQRANWILQAEKQIQVIIQLQEPEYVMKSLEHFADSMVLFFDEVRMLPPPPDFTSTQAEIFEEEIAQQASVLADKAIGYYKLAVRFGDGLLWTGSAHPRMKKKVDILETELRKL